MGKMAIDCTVHFGGRAAILRVDPLDSIAALVVRACDAFEISSATEKGSMRLRNRRGETELDSNASSGDVIQDGDDLDLIVGRVRAHSATTVEEARRRTLRSKASLGRSVAILHRSTKSVRNTKRETALPAPDGLPGCRLGMFVVSPIKGEYLVPSGRFRAMRASLAIRLLPYTTSDQAVPTANGPDYAWATPLRFKHGDTSASGLIISIDVFEDPPLGSRALVGRAFVTLEDALDAPGVSAVRWIRVDGVGDGDTEEQQGGRLLVSLCFHPKVSKGPTVHEYLHALAHGDGDHVTAEQKPTQSSKPSFFQSLLGRRRRRKHDLITGQAAVLHKQQSLRRSKGTLSFSLRGIHICGPQCSSIDGHSSLSLPDFAPVVAVRYDTFEQELFVGPTQCESATFDHEWAVYSTFTTIDLEILRRVTLVTGSTSRRLQADGTSVVKIGGVSISCFDILEREAAGWTLDPPAPTVGPGRNAPMKGYDWYPLMIGDEEIGLAQVAATYTEALLALVDTEESPDVAYVPPDERAFEASIVQRNFERLDELFTQAKEVSGWVDDTLDWKSPLRTIVAYSTINLACFFVPGDHLPLIMILALLAMLTASLVAFVRGNTHTKWIELTPTTSRLKIFRSIAMLRVAPLRATHLTSVVGPQDLADSFVRVFFEPNFKKLPVRQVAQTECARRSENPDWSRPQRDNLSRDAFLLANNSRFKDLVRHLSPFAQEAVLHDVVEPWPRQDGGTDAHAFRFSILQPVKSDATKNEEELVEWHDSPSVIRFDVMQDMGGQEPSVLMGRVRLPIRSLVNDEGSGGDQEELTLQLPLALPPRHATVSSSQSSPQHNATLRHSLLTVRVQLSLRDPNDRVTMADTLASEALYEATELEAERELSWVEKYHKAKDVAKNIQQALGTICSTLERFKNLFLWVHPRKTLLMYLALLVASVGFYFVPMRFIVLYASTKAFTRRFHKIVDKDLVRLQNLLVSIPSDLDMKRLYRRKNQEFLLAKEHTEAKAKLKALWSGDVTCQRFSWLPSWHERYCAIRGGRLELWQCMGDAKAGLPPKQSFPIGNVVETCTRSEAEDVPRDCYPLVIVDVSRSLLTMAPTGKRRIFCVKSDDALRSFAEAVRTTGEPMGSSVLERHPHSL